MMTESQCDSSVKIKLKETKLLPKWATCVVCKLTPKTKVVSFSCLHVCCTDCVETLFLDENPSCRECYQKVDRNALNECSYLNENIIEETDKVVKSPSDIQVCRSCIRQAPAYRWCSDCQDFLCEYCTDHHSFQKLTRSHHLAPMSEAITDDEQGIDLKEFLTTSVTSPDRKCSLHLEEDLTTFCDTCKSALCSSCLLNWRHDDHSTKSLEKLADDFQKEFYSGIETLRVTQEKSEEAIKNLDSKLKTILSDQKLYLHWEARTFIKRLIDALLKKEILLRKELVEATLTKAKELNIKKARATSLIKQCSQYINVAQELVDHGNYWNILHQEESLRKQFKELSAAHSMLTEQEKFDELVEKDYAFTIEDLPVRMAELWISRICKPVYTNLKQLTPKSENGSSGEAEYFQRLSNYAAEAEKNKKLIQNGEVSPPENTVIQGKPNKEKELSPLKQVPVKKRGRPKGSRKSSNRATESSSPNESESEQSCTNSDDGRRPKRIISAPKRLDDETTVSVKHGTRLSLKSSLNDNLNGGKKKRGRPSLKK